MKGLKLQMAPLLGDIEPYCWPEQLTNGRGVEEVGSGLELSGWLLCEAEGGRMGQGGRISTKPAGRNL